MAYRCWHLEDYDPEDPGSGWLAKNATAADDAAETYAKCHHADNDYANITEVVVLSPDGTRKVFDVAAVQTVAFWARESTTPVPTQEVAPC